MSAVEGRPEVVSGGRIDAIDPIRTSCADHSLDHFGGPRLGLPVGGRVLKPVPAATD
jgi:hypothetical protein